MARAQDSENVDLQDTLDEVCDLLDEALDPELTREEVIAKLKDAYDVASGECDQAEEDDGVDPEDA